LLDVFIFTTIPKLDWEFDARCCTKGVGAGTGTKLIEHLMLCDASQDDFHSTGSKGSQAVVLVTK